MSDIPAEGLRFIASAVRRGANPPGVPALLDEAAAELTRLRADLAQLEQESDAEITALRACLASAEADLSAAQEREGALREALVRLEAMVRILPPDMDEPGSALAQARTALGEPQ